MCRNQRSKYLYVTKERDGFQGVLVFLKYPHMHIETLGDAVETCAQNPKVCPTAETLGSIINLSLWAESVEGEFEITNIYMYIYIYR